MFLLLLKNLFRFFSLTLFENYNIKQRKINFTKELIFSDCFYFIINKGKKIRLAI